MVTVPPTITGAVVAELAAVHSCLRLAGTSRARVGLGAAVAAGRLIVARDSYVLVHGSMEPGVIEKGVEEQRALLHKKYVRDRTDSELADAKGENTGKVPGR